MSMATKIIIITILVGCAILSVMGGSLITSASDRPTAQATHLNGSD
jgi:hypothetical protein